MSSNFLRLLPLCAAAEGWLQRVVILGSEAHVIEEIQLFETAQPVDSLTISHAKVRKQQQDVFQLLLFLHVNVHSHSPERPLTCEVKKRDELTPNHNNSFLNVLYIVR